MLVAPRPESIGEAEKVRLIDAIQDQYQGTLDHLVLERGDPEWPLRSVGFRDVHPSDWLCSVRSSSQARGEVFEVALQLLSVALPRCPVDSRCRVPLEAKVRLAQGLDVVNVVQERREPSSLVRLRCLPYAVPRTVHAFPALCPERVLWSRIPLGLPPSLHPLRRRRSAFARNRRLRLAVSSVSTFVPV